MPVSEDKGEKAAIAVTSKDKEGKKKEAAVELSEEDQSLKDGLELAVTRLKEADEGLYQQAISHLIAEIRSSTASMTSVPKPLKFLRPHYNALKEVHASWPDSQPSKHNLADVLSVLAMTMAAQGSRECLGFKLQGAPLDISSWGHEYVRSLSGEISEEYNQRRAASLEENFSAPDLMALVDVIVPFQIGHNAEADATDLLIEVEKLEKLVTCNKIDAKNYERVCLYLLRCADFAADPDDFNSLLSTAYEIYKIQQKYTDALRVALKIDDLERVGELFESAPLLTQQQMAFILGRHRSRFEAAEESLNDLIGNARLSEQFLAVARDMDVLAPKAPEDIFKSHLSEGGMSRRAGHAAMADSAKANLASTFVNAFANAGFCADKLMVDETDSSQWVFKNKDHGMTSAAASLGLIYLWNVDDGLNKIDKYLIHSDNNIKAGACLAVGMVTSGVRNESDPALALLTDYIEGASSGVVKQAAITGLGIAYAGQERVELLDMLAPIVANNEVTITEASLAALSLGLVFSGTCNEEASSVMVQRLMESTETDLNQTEARFLCLGLGLLYLGKGERADAVLEAVRVVDHKLGRYAEVTLETCAYAGTGNVLKVQELLRVCAVHLPEASGQQAAAVLGIALTVLGEDVGTEMALRTFDHLLHYAEQSVRRVVPLAIALMYVSTPDYGIIDQLSRLSHDGDLELSMNAIFGLGLISAGSNNSRVAGLLRQLSDFYAKEASHLFVVRIAQGLNAAGKGLVGMSPFHSDRLLLCGPAIGGILVVLHACLDMSGTILDKHHYLLYHLAAAMHPRFLSTVDADLKPQTCTVRVGLAVETVGQAGRPKTITGFQTHSTPVLLNCRDRAELAGSEFTAVSSVMEGVVIVEKAPLEAGGAAAK